MSELIDKQVVLDTIHLFFTEEIDKIPTKKTEDGEVLIMCKAQPLFAMNKAICKRIKALPSVSPTQNCVGSALDMRCDDAISRQAVDEIKELMTDINGDTVYAVRMSDIRQLLPVNPQEPKTDALDKIRAEIEELADADGYGDYQLGFSFGLMMAMEIIDRYKAKSDNCN